MISPSKSLQIDSTSPNLLSDDNALLPLVNVVFLILLFILVAGSISRSDPNNVRVPDSVNDNATFIGNWDITVAENGDLAFNGLPMKSPGEFAAALAQINSLNVNSEKLAATIRADASVPVEQLSVVLSVLKQAGAQSTKLITVRASTQ